MVCIIYLALASAALHMVDWKGVFSSLTFSSIAGTVGILPVVSVFRMCSSFVDLLCHFHSFKQFACLLVGLPLKVPYLYVGLISQPLVTDYRRISFISSGSILLVSLDPLKIGSKLFSSVIRAENLLNGRCQRLHIYWRISRFCLERAFIGGNHPSKPS